MLNMHAEMHVELRIKCLFLHDLNQHWNVSTNASQTSQHKNP
jgi:hypothetical protein